MEVLKLIEKEGVVPVLALDKLEDAIPVARSLQNAGINIIEVTFRTLVAADIIRVISENFKDMLVGAGTVLSKEQVDKAIESGAKFIVSPGLNEEVVKYCKEKNIDIIPGAITPSEIEKALSLGLLVVKFFPAKQMGGLEYIKAVSAPYKNVKFMPTGGINENNLEEYLNNKSVIACGGSFMFKKELLENKKFEEIEILSRKAKEIVEKVRRS